MVLSLQRYIETNSRMFCSCPFSIQVCKDMENSLNMHQLQSKGNILENFKEFFVRREIKKLRFIPFLFVWRLWTARNESIFEDRMVPSFQVAAQTTTMLPHFQDSPKTPKVKICLPPHIKKATTYGFFDGTSQNKGLKCGIEYFLHLSDAHYYTGKYFLGTCSHNYGEFTSIILLTKVDLKKPLKSVQIFGDSTSH